MPPLSPYSRELPYAYAAGLFPALEALRRAPERVRRVLVSPRLTEGEGAQALLSLCGRHGVRVEEADRLLRRISGKDNCFAAAVIDKRFERPDPRRSHLALVNPMDPGNLGTVLRAALGLGFLDLALVRPCADPFEPQAVRAGMGAVLSMNVYEYPGFDAYRDAYPGHRVVPFMLEGARPLSEAAGEIRAPFCLVFGNEGSGLPPEFARFGAVKIEQTDRVDSLNLAAAAAIGLYAFRQI